MPVRNTVVTNGDEHMKIGIVVSSNDAETYWNAIRYANFCLGQKDKVKVFFLFAAKKKFCLTNNFSMLQFLHS